jgi:hypothetical protein
MENTVWAMLTTLQFRIFYLSISYLSKDLKIKIYITIILLAVSYGISLYGKNMDCGCLTKF